MAVDPYGNAMCAECFDRYEVPANERLPLPDIEAPNGPVRSAGIPSPTAPAAA